MRRDTEAAHRPIRVPRCWDTVLLLSAQRPWQRRLFFSYDLDAEVQGVSKHGGRGGTELVCVRKMFRAPWRLAAVSKMPLGPRGFLAFMNDPAPPGIGKSDRWL